MKAPKKVKVTAGGEKHIVYKKTTKKGEGLAKKKIGGSTKSCWPGYTKKGTKMLNGKVVNNCVKGM